MSGKPLFVLHVPAIKRVLVQAVLGAILPLRQFALIERFKVLAPIPRPVSLRHSVRLSTMRIACIVSARLRRWGGYTLTKDQLPAPAR